MLMQKMTKEEQDDIVEIEGKKIKLTLKFLAEQIGATQLENQENNKKMDLIIQSLETFRQDLTEAKKYALSAPLSDSTSLPANSAEKPKEPSPGLRSTLGKKFDQATVGELLEVVKFAKDQPPNPLTALGEKIVNDGLYEMFKQNLKTKSATPGTS